MKKIAILLTASVGVWVGSALAADGRVDIGGQVGATTCVITGTNGSDVTVTLPTVGGASLTNAGQTAGQTPFSISLSQCNGNTAQTHFELSAAVDQSSGNLYNAGTATNVEVQLLNDMGLPINLLTNNNSQIVTLSGTSPNKSQVLKYFAQYYATGGGATSGSVTSSVQYSMLYN